MHGESSVVAKTRPLSAGILRKTTRTSSQLANFSAIRFERARAVGPESLEYATKASECVTKEVFLFTGLFLGHYLVNATMVCRLSAGLY
jgi:hypothetical protein